MELQVGTELAVRWYRIAARWCHMEGRRAPYMELLVGTVAVRWYRISVVLVCTVHQFRANQQGCQQAAAGSEQAGNRTQAGRQADERIVV